MNRQAEKVNETYVGSPKYCSYIHGIEKNKSYGRTQR